MPVDDDILTSTGPAPDAAAPVRRSNRRFWLVAGSLLVACVFLLIEIFANFGTKDTIAHAEYTLRAAQSAVGTARQTDGTRGLDPARLAAVEPSLRWVAGDQPSTALDMVSIATQGSAWGATVMARPGACFYIHETSGGTVSYGVGTVCTGEQALQATDPQW